MSTGAVLRSRFPTAYARTARYAGMPGQALDYVGNLAWFTFTAIGSMGHALRYYRKEMLRLVAQIGMGTGAMAVVGGTVAIVAFTTLSGSSLVAIQGFASLGYIGVEVFTGFGEKWRTAESVAEGTVHQVRDYLVHSAPVGEHLADQLLMPMALGGVSEFVTSAPTSHFTSNAEVIAMFTGRRISAEERGGHHVVSVDR